MDPMTIGLIMGAVKAQSDEGKEKRDRQMQAGIAKYSPWTGMKAQPGQIQSANPVGDIAQGGLTGAMYGAQNPTTPATTDAGGAAPMSDAPSNAEATQTPAMAAIGKGQFPAYAQGAYMSPWRGMGVTGAAPQTPPPYMGYPARPQ